MPTALMSAPGNLGQRPFEEMSRLQVCAQAFYNAMVTAVVLRILGTAKIPDAPETGGSFDSEGAGRLHGCNPGRAGWTDAEQLALVPTAVMRMMMNCRFSSSSSSSRKGLGRGM